MNYMLARDGQQLGQFTEEQIRAGLGNGTHRLTDFAWCDGMTDWKVLGELFPQRSSGAPPLPAQGTMPAPFAAKKSSGVGIAIVVIGVIFFGVFLLAILAALAMPVFSTVREKGNTVKQINDAKQLVLGCKIYASGHNGSYPKTLDELVPAGALDQETLLKLTSSKNPSWRGEDGFDYFGATVKESDDARKVLLRSKSSSRTGQRVEAYNDGSVSQTRGESLTPRR
jgi:hypothetical protein